MTELEKALEAMENCDYARDFSGDELVFAAARKWASLTSPETIEKGAEAIAVRTVLEANGGNMNQRPIVWCIEHNDRRHFMADVCYRFLYERPDQDCEFSWGGPDHRWWEDEEEKLTEAT